MSNFESAIIFNAIDNVSKVAGKITSTIKGMETTNRKLSSAFNQVTVAGAAFASNLKYLGLAAGGAGLGLFYLADKTSDAAEELLNLSQRTGVSVEELQRLSYVSEQANISSDSLAQSMKFLNKAIADASVNATSEAATAFNAMGVSITDANGALRSTESIFYDLSDVFENAPDGANKVRTALTLLGRAGTDLIPILNRGSKAIREEGLQFDKFGNLMDKNALQNIAGFNDVVSNLRLSLKGLGSVIAQAVIPYLQPLTQKLADYLANNKELLKLNVVSFVESFAKGLQKVWGVVTQAASAFSVLLDKVGGVKTLIIGLGVYMASDLIISFGKLAASLLTLGRIFFTTPFGLVIAGLTAIGYGLYKLNEAFPELGDAVIGTVSIMAEKFATFVSDVWNGLMKILEALHLIDDEKKKQEDAEKLKKGGTVTNNGFSTTLGQDGVFRTAAAEAVSADKTMTSGGDQGGLAAVLDTFAKFAEQQKQAYEMTLNLNTKNEVTNLDIDSPIPTNVNVSTGPMLVY